MKESRLDAGLFAAIKDHKGKLYAFEVSKNPHYEEADDESQFICHLVLVDQKGALTPYLSYKTYLKKKEFCIISCE